MNHIRAAVETAFERFSRVSSEHAASAARSPDRRALAHELETATADLNAAQEEARQQFGGERDWRYSSRLNDVADLLHGRISRFSTNRDYPVADHLEGFIDASGKPVGVVTHSYAEWPAIERYAAERGLAVERMAWSWHNPVGCIAALVTVPSS